MISKYAGNCKRCGKPYRAGEQIEWSKEEGARHPDCASTGDPASLADELGYIDHAEAARVDWTVRMLPPRDFSVATGRAESAAPGRSEPNLFGEE